MSFGAELLLSCASIIDPTTMHALVTTESAYNPYAIAIVDGTPLKTQPKTRSEAEIIIDDLEAKGLNYSVGLGQVNKVNFAKYGTNGKMLLNACENLDVSSRILAQCYKDSPSKSVSEALSCYYAGNFSYGFVKEKVGKGYTAYIERIIKNYKPSNQIIVPSLEDEIPQALAKVREPRKKTTAKTQKSKNDKSTVTLTAKRDDSSKPKKLIKNLSVIENSQEQVTTTFKF